MNNTINKKCAVCGRTINQFSDQFQISELQKNAPLGEGARAFFFMWHFSLEECPFCDYVSQDITTCYEKEKEVVLSEEYKKIFDNKIIDQLMDEIDCYASKFEAYAVLCEKMSNYSQSSKSYLNAFFVTLQSANDWLREASDEEEPTKEQLDFFDRAVGLSEEYLKKACSLLQKEVMKNPTCTANLFLLVYTYYYLHEKKKALSICEKLKQYKLKPVEGKVLIYLQTLVETDEFIYI